MAGRHAWAIRQESLAMAQNVKGGKKRTAVAAAVSLAFAKELRCSHKKRKKRFRPRETTAIFVLISLQRHDVFCALGNLYDNNKH